eukprot:6924-Heterococcus_DN1.PRE.4
MPADSFRLYKLFASFVTTAACFVCFELLFYCYCCCAPASNRSSSGAGIASSSSFAVSRAETAVALYRERSGQRIQQSGHNSSAY